MAGHIQLRAAPKEGLPFYFPSFLSIEFLNTNLPSYRNNRFDICLGVGLMIGEKEIAGIIDTRRPSCLLPMILIYQKMKEMGKAMR